MHYIHLIQELQTVFVNAIAHENHLSFLTIGKPARKVFPGYKHGFHPSSIMGSYNYQPTSVYIRECNDAYNQFYFDVTGNSDPIDPFPTRTDAWWVY